MQVIAFGIFSNARHVAIFRTVVAEQISLQGNEGTNCFLIMNSSQVPCIPEC